MHSRYIFGDWNIDLHLSNLLLEFTDKMTHNYQSIASICGQPRTAAVTGIDRSYVPRGVPTYCVESACQNEFEPFIVLWSHQDLRFRRIFLNDFSATSDDCSRSIYSSRIRLTQVQNASYRCLDIWRRYISDHLWP